MYKLKMPRTATFILSKVDNEIVYSSDPKFDVVICDVTPVDLEHFKNVDVTFYYGDVTTACKMVKDVIDVAVDFRNERKHQLKIALKPKRRLDDKTINPKYIDFINQTKLRYDNFSVLSQHQNTNRLPPKTLFISSYTSIAKLAFTGVKVVVLRSHWRVDKHLTFFDRYRIFIGFVDLESKMTDAFLDVRGKAEHEDTRNNIK